MLPEHVGNPQISLDLDKLHGAQLKSVLLLEPVSIGLLGFRSSRGDRRNKALSPAPLVVADMGDDLAASAAQASRIACEIVDVSGH
jgi:hypothetical protein